MKKVFISQPMRGKTAKEITSQREAAIKDIRGMYGDDFEVIDTIFTDYEPDGGCTPLKYLAKSIELLADADVAYFCDGWEKARGCRIEQNCASRYGIGVIYQGAENQDHTFVF